MGHTGFAPAQGSVRFWGLHCSGSRVFCCGTVQSGPCFSCTSQVSAAQVLRYSARAQTQLHVCFVTLPGLSSSRDQVFGKCTVPGGLSILITSLVQPLGLPGAPWEHHLRCAMCLLWGADLRLQTSWWMSTVQDPRKTWLAIRSLLTVGWRIPVSGAEVGAASCLPALIVTHLPLCLWWGCRQRGVCMQPASSPSVFAQSFVLWVCQATSWNLLQGSSLSLSLSFFFSSLAIPQFELLSHFSSFRLPLGHSGPVLTLRTEDAAGTSLSSACSLVVDVSVWATSLLAGLGAYSVGCVFFPPSYVALWDSKTPTDPPVRGFPTVWKLLLLHYSLPRTGLHP